MKSGLVCSCLFLCALLCGPLAARAQNLGTLTAGQLHESCVVAETLGADIRELTDAERIHLGYCVGAVNAAVYYLRADRALYKDKGYFKACIPESRTMAQIMFIVRYYLEQRPEVYEEDAMKHVTAALQKAFPCPRKAGN
ncbi:MAG: hypothetical protein K9G62_08360 [Alphaproteobacteria bacterium]|nr:hypothetical protein [Alphaproteobacteria bacterium]